MQAPLPVGMYQMLVSGDEIHVVAYLGGGGHHGFCGDAVQSACIFHVQSAVGTYPYALPAVGIDVAHVVGAQFAIALAVLMGFNAAIVIFDFNASRVGIPQPGVAPGRDITVAVVAGIVARGGEVDKLTPVGVVAAVALALQTDEEQSVGILVQLADAVVEQEGIVAFFRMLEHIERVAVVSAETVARGQPDIALRVLHHINNVVAGQSVFGAQIAVFQFCLAPRADRY